MFFPQSERSKFTVLEGGKILVVYIVIFGGWDTFVGTVTCNGLEGQGIEFQWL